jgi:hypothetical protein
MLGANPSDAGKHDTDAMLSPAETRRLSDRLDKACADVGRDPAIAFYWPPIDDALRPCAGGGCR